MPKRLLKIIAIIWITGIVYVTPILIGTIPTRLYACENNEPYCNDTDELYLQWGEPEHAPIYLASTGLVVLICTITTVVFYTAALAKSVTMGKFCFLTTLIDQQQLHYLKYITGWQRRRCTKWHINCHKTNG